MALTNEEILEAIASKTVLEISELIKMMEPGVSAAAAAVGSAPRLALPPLLKKRRNSTSLESAGSTRSPSCNSSREMTGLGLKEAGLVRSSKALRRLSRKASRRLTPKLLPRSSRGRSQVIFT